MEVKTIRMMDGVSWRKATSSTNPNHDDIYLEGMLRIDQKWALSRSRSTGGPPFGVITLLRPKKRILKEICLWNTNVSLTGTI
ncbi:hypothetical protein TNCV_3037801 [Trichonephila clavipes]|nr:hypothetical protein TNCV_3037801 [Trichonephila clavipes]